MVPPGNKRRDNRWRQTFGPNVAANLSGAPGTAPGGRIGQAGPQLSRSRHASSLPMCGRFIIRLTGGGRRTHRRCIIQLMSAVSLKADISVDIFHSLIHSSITIRRQTF